MISFAPYRHRPNRLEDFLPWALLVGPGIILNKDGSFQRTARFRGPDTRSSTPEELASFAARANTVFKRLGSGWALYIEADRRPITSYPQGAFADDLSRLIDAERATAFEEAGAQFETVHHLTLQWAPPEDKSRKAQAFFFEIDQRRSGAKSKASSEKGSQNGSQAGSQTGSQAGSQARSQAGSKPGSQDGSRPGSKLKTAAAMGAATAEPADHRLAREALDAFERASSQAFLGLAAITTDLALLDDDATLTYLKGTVSPTRQIVRAPAGPAFLDGLLCDAPLLGGTAPMLGDQHLRVLTLKGFPPATSPGILDELNGLGITYRWMTRYLCLDRGEAEHELAKWRRLWFSKHKSLGALVKEMMTQEAASFSDPDALAKSAEADAALGELGAEAVGFGYLTTTLVVMGATAAEADEKLRVAERVMAARGFVSVAETLNAVEAWLSSLPGQAWANVRHPLVSTLNLAHIAPLSTPWAGEAWNAHLDAPPLALARTDGSTPFRLDLHVGDVGHTLVVGPTGAGKSVLLAFLALQWRRYQDAQVIVFDKGGSARAAVLGLGGAAFDLGGASLPPVQPLARIDDPAERSRALDWVMGLAAQEGVPPHPHTHELIWSALQSLAAAPPNQRHLTGLRLLVQDQDLKAALLPYTQEGAYGAIFDGDEDRLALGDVVLFEMEEIMGRPKAVVPALLYLFDRLEARFDGRPTLLILDEAWLFLDSPLFAARLRAWLKALRKKNVAVVFATQSLADIASSSIAPALIENCPTRVYLPNARAFEPLQRSVYERFGLNPAEIGLIAQAAAKRDYYYASPKGRRVFDLSLGPIALSVCAASDPASRTLVSRLEAEISPLPFWRRFLEARRLGWVLEALDDGARDDEPLVGRARDEQALDNETFRARARDPRAVVDGTLDHRAVDHGAPHARAAQAIQTAPAARRPLHPLKPSMGA